MNLQDYYRQKRRKAAALKLAGLFLVLSLAAVAIWGLIWVLRGLLATPEYQPKEQNIAPPWLIFCATSACFYVDANGVLSESAPRFSKNPLPELYLAEKGAVKIGERIMSEEEVSFLAVFLNALKDMSAAPERIAISAGGIKISLKEGWFILVSPELPPEKALGELKLLLDQKIGDRRAALEYVDMRFLNKAFYKLKSVNQD